MTSSVVTYVRSQEVPRLSGRRGSFRTKQDPWLQGLAATRLRLAESSLAYIELPPPAVSWADSGILICPLRTRCQETRVEPIPKKHAKWFGESNGIANLGSA